MATYNQGILGPFSGTVGSVVGSTCHGKFILKAKPAPKKNYTPTAKQRVVQQRFATVNAFLRPFASVIKRGYLSVKTHPANAAFKDAYKCLIADDKIDYDKIQLSNGTAVFPFSSAKAANAVSFSWTAPEASDDFYDGQMIAAAYNVANQKVAIFITDLSAGTLKADHSTLLTNTDDDDVHVYAFAATSAISTPTTHIAG